MRGAVLYGPKDLRCEERETPKILKSPDAIIRISATCVCRSDLWPYRGISPVAQPTPMGHEYCGIVEEIGSAVTSIKPGRFVLRVRQHPSQLSGRAPVVLPARRVCRRWRPCCASRSRMAPGSHLRLFLIPSLLSLSDVVGTGWFAATAANVKPGSTVVGDGGVGLLGVLSAKQMGSERIITMSRHRSRRKLAPEFGATDIVTERGDEGVVCIKELTAGRPWSVNISALSLSAWHG